LKPKTSNLLPKPLCFLIIVVTSLFSFSLQSVGKKILIDKFWHVRLALEQLGNVYGF